MKTRMTDRQIKTAAANLARQLTAAQIATQVAYYAGLVTMTATQLDDWYIHQLAMTFKG